MITFRRLLLSFFPLLLLFFFSCTRTRPGKPRVLIYSQSNVDPALLAQKGGWLVDTTSDSSYFREDSLRQYSAVVFLNMPGNSLDNYGQADLERYIQAGGGYAGVRSSTTSAYEWGWYRRMIGGDSSRTAVVNHMYDGGRAWYKDSLSSFTDTASLRPLIEGIRYAIGENNELR